MAAAIGGLAAKTRRTRFSRLSGLSDRQRAVIDEHRAVLDALDRGAGARAAFACHLDRVFVSRQVAPEAVAHIISD